MHPSAMPEPILHIMYITWASTICLFRNLLNLQHIIYKFLLKEDRKLMRFIMILRGEEKATDLPSLRFSLANPGPWLLESSDELLNEAWDRAGTRGSSQSSARRKKSIRISTVLTAFLASIGKRNKQTKQNKEN